MRGGMGRRTLRPCHDMCCSHASLTEPLQIGGKMSWGSSGRWRNYNNSWEAWRGTLGEIFHGVCSSRRKSLTRFPF